MVNDVTGSALGATPNPTQIEGNQINNELPPIGGGNLGDDDYFDSLLKQALGAQSDGTLVGSSAGAPYIAAPESDVDAVIMDIFQTFGAQLDGAAAANIGAADFADSQRQSMNKVAQDNLQKSTHVAKKKRHCQKIQKAFSVIAAVLAVGVAVIATIASFGAAAPLTALAVVGLTIAVVDMAAVIAQNCGGKTDFSFAAGLSKMFKAFGASDDVAMGLGLGLSIVIQLATTVPAAAAKIASMAAKVGTVANAGNMAKAALNSAIETLSGVRTAMANAVRDMGVAWGHAAQTNAAIKALDDCLDVLKEAASVGTAYAKEGAEIGADALMAAAQTAKNSLDDLMQRLAQMLPGASDADKMKHLAALTRTAVVTLTGIAAVGTGASGIKGAGYQYLEELYKANSQRTMANAQKIQMEIEDLLASITKLFEASGDASKGMVDLVNARREANQYVISVPAAA
ncbi:MAG: hypothetical protein V4623_07840 [Pseudomonadota bacterium]